MKILPGATAALMAGAIIYSTERLVSAIEYHAQRTAAHPPTLNGSSVNATIAHIPDRAAQALHTITRLTR